MADMSLKNIFKFIKSFILFTVIIIILGSVYFYFLFYQNSGDYPKFQYSIFDYSLQIDGVSTNLTNVTLLIPLPEKNGTPFIGDISLTKDFFYQSAPSGTVFSIIRHDNRSMLKFTADQMVQGQGYGANYYNHSRSRVINTRYPVGNESVFIPLSYRELQQSPSLTEVTIHYNISVYSHFSHEGNDSSLSISSEIIYSNSWDPWFDSHIGNEYRDSYSVTVHGDDQWVDAKGSLLSGEGWYPEEPYKNKDLITPSGNTGGGEPFGPPP